MSENKKNYFVGDTTLSEEQKQSVKQFSENQEQQVSELGARQVELQKKKARATLEELLNTRISPEEDRVVVWPDPVSEVTEGNIIKPQQVIDNERPMIGTVICVGPGKTQDNLTQEILCSLLVVNDADPDVVSAYRSRIRTSTSTYTPGTRILYGRLAGTPVQDPDTKEELLIMRPTDIFGRIK